MRLGLGSVVIAASALASACFRGEFLDNTCERLPGGCPDVVTTGDDTTDTAMPDLGASSCPPRAPPEPAIVPPGDGVLEVGPAFRITKIQIVDPHLYYNAILACTDVTGIVNGAINQSLIDYKTNIVFLANDYDPDSTAQSLYFISEALCVRNDGYCAYGSSSAPFLFGVVNDDDDDCAVKVAPNSADEEDIQELNIPVAPCFSSPVASFQLSLVPGAMPLPLYLAHFSAKYAPDDCDPDGLVQGVMTGFITREDAMKAEFTVTSIGPEAKVSLWEVVRGSDTNSCKIPEGEHTGVDAVYLNKTTNPSEPVFTYGVYMYLNIEAERIPMYKVP